MRVIAILRRSTLCAVLFLLAKSLAAEEPEWVKELDRQSPTLHLVCAHDKGSHSTGVTIEVDDYSIANNCLRAVLTVSNASNEDVTVPKRNSEFTFFSARILNSRDEPISYCGGVWTLEAENFHRDIPAKADFLTLRPGEQATIDPGCIAPFWPYLRDKEYDARSFEISYEFYEPEVQVPLSVARGYRKKIAAVRPVVCRLLRTVVTGPRVVIDWSHYAPDHP